MIQTLILSKDRPCQLDLLLRSIEHNLPRDLLSIRVNYIASNEEYERGYDQVASEHNIRLCPEHDLKVDFIDAIREASGRLILLLTDDSVFYRPVRASWKDFFDLFVSNSEMFCFAFRLGLNTIIQNYATGELQPPLNHDVKSFRQFTAWNWTKYYPLHNYGYPIGMDGHMYCADDLLEPTAKLSFTNFRAWEGTFALDKRSTFEHKPWMASFEHSVLVNIPTNNVQYPPIPFGAKYPISITELNRRFLDGERLSLEDMDFSNIRGCHQEIELKWKS